MYVKVKLTLKEANEILTATGNSLDFDDAAEALFADDRRAINAAKRAEAKIVKAIQKYNKQMEDKKLKGSSK